MELNVPRVASPRIMMSLRWALVVVCLAGVVPGNQDASVAAQQPDLIADVDTYAVYRTALAFVHQAGNRPLTEITLLQETRAGRLDCPPPDIMPAEWRPVLANYQTENGRPHRIQPGSDLGVPHTQLTWTVLTRMMQDAGYDLTKFSGQNAPGSEVFSRLRGGRLVALSAVGFDSARTRAMVTVQFNCFPSMQSGVDSQMCREGTQVMLEKQASQWGPASIGGCLWIA